MAIKRRSTIGNKIAISAKTTPFAARRLKRKSPLQTIKVTKAKEEAIKAILK